MSFPITTESSPYTYDLELIEILIMVMMYIPRNLVHGLLYESRYHRGVQQAHLEAVSWANSN
jgi:hypothetical protein